MHVILIEILADKICPDKVRGMGVPPMVSPGGILAQDCLVHSVSPM